MVWLLLTCLMSSFQNWENNKLRKSENSVFLNISFFTECLLTTKQNKTTPTTLSNLLNGKPHVVRCASTVLRFKPGIRHWWWLVGWGISSPHGRTWKCKCHMEGVGGVPNLDVLHKFHNVYQLAACYPWPKLKVEWYYITISVTGYTKWLQKPCTVSQISVKWT